MVAIGDYNDYVGFDAKCSNMVAIAIRGASILATLSVIPVWRGYREYKTGKPHTVLCKVAGYFDSMQVDLISASEALTSSCSCAQETAAAGWY